MEKQEDGKFLPSSFFLLPSSFLQADTSEAKS
jgi:hypothetical protein